MITGTSVVLLQLLQDCGLALKYFLFAIRPLNLNAPFISDESATCHICMSYYGTPNTCDPVMPSIMYVIQEWDLKMAGMPITIKKKGMTLDHLALVQNSCTINYIKHIQPFPTNGCPSLYWL